MTDKPRCPSCAAELPEGAPEGLCPRCLLRVGLQAASGPELTAAYSQGFTPPSPAELQQHFPQLEIVELLGKGGMGAVYKARQVSLDRLVALKILPPEVGSDTAFSERFTREARALAKLNHPNIVGVYDFGQAGGLFYFLMEFVDGVNLRQAMRGGQLTPRQALDIVPQVCDALQFAHDEGVVHRDIKPENILLDRRGRVKIADFGLAKLLGQPATDFALTGTRQMMGTLHYMAPEQVVGARAVDHRADIYSLGVTFYEMLTGELPLGRFPPPSQKAGVDRRLDDVVLRTLEREPEQRYQHASEVKTEVESISRAPMAESAPSLNIARPPFWTTPQPNYARWVGVPMLVLVGLYMLTVFLLLLYTFGPHEPARPGDEDFARPTRAIIAALLCAGPLLIGIAFLVLNVAWAVWGRSSPAAVPAKAEGPPPDWRTRWQRQPEAFRNAVRTALIVGLIAFVAGFLSFAESTTFDANGGATQRLTIGVIQPWYVSLETGRGGGFHVSRSVNVVSLSAGFGALAALCLQALVVLRRWGPREEPAPPPADVTPMVRRAGTALKIVGIVTMFVWVPVMAFYVPFERTFGILPGPIQALFQLSILWSLVAGAVITRGGMEMRALRGHGWATTGSILALVPLSVAVVVGLPVGVWCLAVLRRRETRDEFHRADWVARSGTESEVAGPRTETAAHALGWLVGAAARSGRGRILLALGWTLACIVVFIVFGTEAPRQGGSEAALYQGYVDYWHWPHDGVSESRVSLEPRTPLYRRLVITEHVEVHRPGYRNGDLFAGDLARSGRTRHEFWAELDLNDGTQRTLTVDALDGLSWHHRDRFNANTVRGRLLDVPAALAWMHEWLKAKKNDEPTEELRGQASFLVRLLQQAAGSSTAPTFFVGRQTVGRLDAFAWDLRNHWKNERQDYPFRDGNFPGTSNTSVQPVVPIVAVSVPVTLVVWAVGLWWCRRATPGQPAG